MGRHVVVSLLRSPWFRALVSVALLALFASRIDFGAAGDRLSGGHWLLFVVAALELLVSFIIGAIRWRIYLLAAGLPTGELAVIRSYMIGVFANNFLPSQVGGDVARAWVATGPGTRLRGVATVLVDRATALVCLVAVGWLGYLTDPSAVPGQLVAALAAATGAIALGSVAVVLGARSPAVARIVPSRLQGPARDVRRAAGACLRGPVLARTLLIGLAFQGITVLAAWLVLRSLELHLAFAPLAVSLAPILIVSVLPISIGGFGVREGSYVVLLGYAGVGTTDATLLSLLSALAFALASAPGGLFLVKWPARRLAPAAEPEE